MLVIVFRYNYKHDIKEVYDDAKLVTYESVEQMEKESEQIILASKIKSDSEILTINTVDSISGDTPTEVVIEKIWIGIKIGNC